MSTRPIAIGKLPGALLATLLDGRPVGDPEVLIGPGVGVDAAAIAIGGQILVAKTDPITFATDRAAHYLINVNANDLACLGATPRWLLVTALLPADETTAQTVQDLFAEIRRACAEHGIELVGGHTEITDAVTRPILVGQMLGVATEERLLRPGLGKPGHRLLLTRPIAIEGTALLANQC
ncbi:MAG: AIR synthase related protein, partial [Thermomicrobiales bacterium]